MLAESINKVNHLQHLLRWCSISPVATPQSRLSDSLNRYQVSPLKSDTIWMLYPSQDVAAEIASLEKQLADGNFIKLKDARKAVLGLKAPPALVRHMTGISCLLMEKLFKF